MSRPTIIFFDVAFTLIYPHPSVGSVYAAAAREFDAMVEPAAIDAAFVQAWREARAAAAGLPYGPTDEEARRFWRGVVAQTFRLAGSAMPADPYFDTVFKRFASKESWALYDDVLPAFKRLRASGVRIGVLSNFDSRLRPLLVSMGLMRFIDCVTISCESGAEKPDLRIFRAAEARANVSASEAAMIGDLEREDYDAAIAAGWRAAIIDRKSSAQSSHRFANLLDAMESFLA